jgi:8-oxo-dGTP pyrophosphatase MutT (NUDIX family)
LARAEEGALTRDENPASHFCVYFAAYDPTARQVFIGHHKKSGKWLFNGGHMDADEHPINAAMRESWEEWGLKLEADALGEPQLLTITNIPPEVKYPCQTHYDIWYFVPLDQHQTQFDQSKLASEFYENRWMSIPEAQALTTDPATLQALIVLEKRFA